MIRHIVIFKLKPAMSAQEKRPVGPAGCFDTLDDVRAYSVHPAHRAVAGRLAPYIEVRSCVDYEI